MLEDINRADASTRFSRHSFQAKESFDGMDEPALLSIYTKVVEMSTKLEAVINQMPDHENRIRALEKWRYMLPTSIILAVASVAATVVEILSLHK